MQQTSLPQNFKAIRADGNDIKPKIRELPLEKPGKDQVLVQIAFAPLNQTDLISLEGRIRAPQDSPALAQPIGREGSGIVAAVGEDLKTPWKVGDRVHVHGTGVHAQYYITASEELSPIISDLTLEEAASHIINPGTVAYMVALAKRGGHKAVVSTAASSALGKMLIRALKEKGIKSINTVRQDKYIEELKKEGADYVLNSEAPEFEEKLREIAEREEATVAFDAISGDFTRKILDNLPANSTVYVYGFLDGGDINLSELFTPKNFAGGRTSVGLFYLSYLEEFKQRGELDKYYEEIHAPLKTAFRSHIQKVFTVDEIAQAVDYYRANSSKGKVLIKYN